MIGVANYYQDWISRLVIDKADADSLEAIELLGIDCTTAETIMTDSKTAASLGETLLGLSR